MIFLKICCVGLLIPSFLTAPAAGPDRAKRMMSQNADPQRLLSDAPGSVKYVVQKRSPAIVQSREPRTTAEFYGAKALGQARAWKLKSGVTVAGLAFETPQLEWLRVQNPTQPTEVYVRQDDFAERDQAELKKLQSKYGSAVRFQHLAVIQLGIGRWNGKPPQHAEDFRRIVAVEAGEVMAVTDQGLLTVPEDAIDPAELTELKKKFEQHGSGHNLEVTKFTRVPFAGKLIAETPDSFVLETWEPASTFDFRYPKGTRYRMPKYLMSDLLIRQLSAIVRRFTKQQPNLKLSPQEWNVLPCARQTAYGLKLCYPATNVRQRTVEILMPDGTRTTGMITDLACTDRVAYQSAALSRLENPSGQDPWKAALLAAAADVTEQAAWQLKSAAPARIGKALGAIDDGFAFRSLQGNQPFFVKASQLEEMDRKLLQTAFQKDRLRWLAEIDLEKLFHSRLIVRKQRAELCLVDSQVELKGAILGKVPSPKLVASTEPYSFTGVHVDSLLDAGDASAYLAKYAPLLASNDRAAALEKIAAMRPAASEALPDLSEHIPVTKLEPWGLGNVGSIVFYASLAGKFENDFVFLNEFKGKKQYFLAASSDLSDDSRARADELAASMPARDWPNLLARDANWQYFRIWYDAKRKRTLSPLPCVVAKVGNSDVLMQSIDGQRFTFVWRDAESGEDGAAVYERALREGLIRREKAERDLPRWTFKDCSQTLVANFVGRYDDDILLSDVNGAEFLMFAMSLDENSLKEVKRLSKPASDQRQLTQSELFQLPRMWCGKEELLGPAQLVNYLDLGQVWLQVKNKDKELVNWGVGLLTHREQLATESLWLRQSQNLKDDRSFDALLAQPIAGNEVVRQTPALLPAIKERIDKAWDDEQRELVWQSTSVPIDAKATLVAVDRDATCAVIIDAEKHWQAVDFKSGQQQRLDDAFREVPASGPWLYRGPKELWWVAEGQLKKRDANGQVVPGIPDGNRPRITSADQSGDFESLVLHFADRSIAKLELSTGRVQELRPGSDSRLHDEDVRLTASLDGSAVVTRQEDKALITAVFGRQTDEAMGGNVATSAHALESVAVGRQYVAATIAVADVPFVYAWASTVRKPQAQSLGLPVVPQLISFVNLGPGAEEELQVIGKPSDIFSREDNWSYVLPVSLNGQTRKDQMIQGEFDENALLAGDGAAIVHKKGGAYVVSRRPAEVPRWFRIELSDLAKELVLKLDIGQLEAITAYLEQAKFREHCDYPGATSDMYFNVLKLACIRAHAESGSDRMERARLAAEKMLEKFPKSHLAPNLLVEWHLDRAWDARGSGYADTVSERGWETFKTEIRKAAADLKPLLESSDTIAATYASAIAIAMAGNAPLDEMRKLAVKLSKSRHAENAELHRAIMQYLLPRWHGQPGMTEAYALNVAAALQRSDGDALYAKMIADIGRFGGDRGPVTLDMEIDFDRLVDGTKQYYEKWNDSDVMSQTLLLLYLSRHTDPIAELLRLRAEKHILPDAASNASWQNFRNLELLIEAK